MMLRPQKISLASLALVAALTGCNNTVFIPLSYISAEISPRPATVAQATSVVLTASVSSTVSVPQWSVLDASYTGNVGTLTPIPGSADSILYTAPPTPPIYSQTPTGITQGSVTVQVTVTNPAEGSSQVVPDAITFVITSPSISVGLKPATAIVPLGSTAQFIGYAVGNLNNTLIFQVNGVTGGSSTTGTINAAGTYVAPSTMPITGSTVTVSAVSQADPTKTASAQITLQ